MTKVLVLVLMWAGVPEETCSEALRTVVEAPREAFGESRQVAVDSLGMPRRISVEVGESRHDLGDGEFLPRVHFRLKYRHLELRYGQPAAGGREMLEEVVVRGPEPKLRLPFSPGATLPEVRAAVGEPADAGERFLSYGCPDGVAADEVRFRFGRPAGGLSELTWVYSSD